MPINFPKSPSLNDTYTYEGKTWKYNAQGAWEVSASTETGNEQGNTGEIAYYDSTGSIIQGATAFFYDATNLRVGVGTTIPDHTLDITGPSGTLNVKGGATFGGDVWITPQYAMIGQPSSRIQFNGAGGQMTIDCDTIDIPRKLRHLSDTDTVFQFDADNVSLSAGGNVLLEGNSGLLHIPTGISASQGATFAGDVVFQGNLLLPEDGQVGIGGDTEKIVFNGEGSGSSSIDIKCSNVDFGLGSGSSLRSHGDTDTQIKFVNDKHGVANDGLELQQSGNVIIDVTPTQVNVAGVTFGAGGATFGDTVTIHSAGDVTLNLIADTDNSGENDNPLISMGQDGDEGNFTLGIVGNSGQIFTNSLSNAAYLNTKWGHNDLQFGVYGDMKMTILDSGNVGIGTNTPGSTMDIIGGLNVSQGATFGSTVNLKTYTETKNAVSDQSSSFDVTVSAGSVQTVKCTSGTIEVGFTGWDPSTTLAQTVTLIIEDGGNINTWDSAVKWPSDVAPSLTADGIDIITFMTPDAGTTVYGFVGGLNFS